MTIDFRRVALSAGLAIVSTILVVMASRAIFPSPKYPECRSRPTAAVAVKEGAPVIPSAEEEECQRQEKVYQERQEQVAKNQFFILLAGSVALILVGGLLYTVPVVSSGILWGGVVSLFFSLISSFREGIEDYFRLLAAVVAFIILVVLSYRMFGKERGQGSK